MICKITPANLSNSERQFLFPFGYFVLSPKISNFKLFQLKFPITYIPLIDYEDYKQSVEESFRFSEQDHYPIRLESLVGNYVKLESLNLESLKFENFCLS